MLSFCAVRRYVDGLKESSQLMDLLAADTSEAIEPTKSVAAREQVYPDVCSSMSVIQLR